MGFSKDQYFTGITTDRIQIVRVCVINDKCGMIDKTMLNVLIECILEIELSFNMSASELFITERGVKRKFPYIGF